MESNKSDVVPDDCVQQEKPDDRLKEVRKSEETDTERDKDDKSSSSSRTASLSPQKDNPPVVNDVVDKSPTGRPLLLRPSKLGSSSSDQGTELAKDTLGSSGTFGVKQSIFGGGNQDESPTGGGGSSKSFQLRHSKLSTGDSTAKENSVLGFSAFGSKQAFTASDTWERPAAPRLSKPLILRPSKLATVTAEQKRDSNSGVTSSENATKEEVASGLNKDSNSSSSPAKTPVLRPSQLAATTADLQISDKAIPPKNPFARVSASFDDPDEKDVKKPTVSSSSDKAVVDTAPSIAPKFVPLGSGSTVVNPAASVTQAAPTFVFGQNLLERVETKESPRPAGEGGHIEANGSSSSEMLFSSAVRKEGGGPESDSTAPEKPSKSLSDAAREYEESRAAKRKYEEVAVVTGEEDEVNVLQLDCKLYAFEKAKGSWAERGRGTLRLNDRDQQSSRLVVRTAGSLRVVVNTKVWPGMVVERPGAKSVRLTALDASGDLKVFLVTTAPKDADSLHRALLDRVERLRAAPAAPDSKRVAQDADGDADLGAAP